MLNCGSFELAQRDGSQPALLAVGSAPGESGVSVLRYRFAGSKYVSSTIDQHVIFFHLSSPARVECRMAGQILEHEARKGSIGICPAGTDCIAQADGDVDSLLVTVAPGTLSLAAAEEGALEANLIQRVQGDELALLHQAQILAAECRAGYPNGPLYWHAAASNFIESILARHTTSFVSPSRGTLGKEALAKLRDYITANLGEPIDVGSLASIVGRSPFHFTRVFTRSVGVTPHRYVVHLRLRRALELIREEKGSFADVAARTGFADQSHLSRWVRRVHGVSLSDVAA
jgi:AraC family transcriptional regulator